MLGSKFCPNCGSAVISPDLAAPAGAGSVIVPVAGEPGEPGDARAAKAGISEEKARLLLESVKAGREPVNRASAAQRPPVAKWRASSYDHSDDDRPLPMPTDSVVSLPVDSPASDRSEGVDPPDPTVRFLTQRPGAEAKGLAGQAGGVPSPRFEPKRFGPGQLINKRYLVIAQIGEGAMGEVYRAEDKRLGGDVALKFLSLDAATDADNLKRLHAEASLARTVTHPNVCRVFDIGDVDGQPFISMEFVDGETISSLLRRIGRLPADKALSVAHQICAGLAWAHERKVLHRDLKPANIMLDGNGEVRIADFGLSTHLEDLGGDRRRAGTPAYMAPEVLRGKGATARSDLFSLGLILYEIFTGKPVYRPTTISQLEAMHDLPIPSPATIVPDINPGVERAIMLCLEREPSLRPASARELAAILPGGDPLVAALEAGQIPSVRQVAAAGGEGVMSGEKAAYLTAAMLIAMTLAISVGQYASLLRAVPLRKSVPVLVAAAENVVERLGYSPETRYKASGFDFYEEYVELIRERDQSESRWNRLSFSRPSPIDFWYRQSPRPLTTENSEQRVTMNDPAFAVGGMVKVRLDTKGRLREFLYFTPAEPSIGLGAVEARSASAETLQQGAGKATTGVAKAEGVTPRTDWRPIFELAGLSLDAFTVTSTVRVPPVFADERFTWEGVYPDVPSEQVRIEGASLGGKAVAFRIVEKQWVGASVTQPQSASGWLNAGRAFSFITEAIAVIAIVILAAKNLRERTGDLQTALRLGVAMGLASVASLWLYADHPRYLPDEMQFLVRASRMGVPTAVWFWLAYIAIEPYARRVWPETLISWSRFIRGGVTSPLVGHHVVWGCVGGVFCAAIAYMHRLSAPWIGSPPTFPWFDPERGIEPLQGLSNAMGAFVSLLPFSAKYAFTFLVMLLLLKLVIKRKWIAATAYTVLQTLLWTLLRGDSPISIVFMGAVASISALLLVRVGMLGLMVGVLTFHVVVIFAPAISYGAFWTPTALTALAAIGAVFSLALLAALGVFRADDNYPLASGKSQ